LDTLLEAKMPSQAYFTIVRALNYFTRILTGLEAGYLVAFFGFLWCFVSHLLSFRSRLFHSPDRQRGTMGSARFEITDDRQ
jgi:hypothetical protein